MIFSNCNRLYNFWITWIIFYGKFIIKPTFKLHNNKYFIRKFKQKLL